MFLLLAFFFNLPFILLASPTNRIVGGQLAQNGQFPWQAAVDVTTDNGRQLCSGALVTDNWVLTSVSCIIGQRETRVYLGSVSINLNEEDENRRLITIRITISDSAFDPNTLSNDICALKILDELVFTDYVQPIRVSNVHVDEGTSVQLAGWGLTSDVGNFVDDLNFVILVTISNPECQSTYGSGVVTDEKICAVGNPAGGSCTGDTGAPLVAFDDDNVPFLAGFGSFISSRGCEAEDPSGFTRTEAYYDFITHLPIIVIGNRTSKLGVGKSLR